MASGSKSGGLSDPQIISNLEPCSFTNKDIASLKSKGVFPDGVIFRPFDPSLHADFYSDDWVCFPEFPFTLGLQFPFPPLFEDFFNITGLCYSQTMPMIWRTLFVIQNLIELHDLEFGISELAHGYNLRSHGNCYFLFQVRANRQYLVHRTTQNDPKWKSRFFFVKRDSLPSDASIPTSWVSKAEFSKLAPATPLTEGRIRKYLEIPESERTFRNPQASESTGSQQSRATMSAHFSLSDIDVDTPVPKKIPTVADVKPRIPNLRSKSAAKRKKPIDLDEEVPGEFEKLLSQLTKLYQEKQEVIDDLQRMAQARIDANERDAAELVKVKKELKELKSSVLKQTAAAEAKVKTAMLKELKRDAAIAVLEARIKMASEAAAKGFDTSIWGIQVWKDKLAGLRGEDPEVESSLGAIISKISTSSPVKPLEVVPDEEMADRDFEGKDTEEATPGNDGK